MKEKEKVNMNTQESLHTCGRSHSLYTSPNAYSGQSKESVEESLGRLFLEIVERLEREGKLSGIIESLNKEDSNARNRLGSEL